METGSNLWRDTLVALRFYSRLPVPPIKGEAAPHGAPNFSHLSRVVPLVGAILGGLCGLVLVPAAWLWPPVVAAVLAVAAGVLLTGAFHEDGLADAADGLGGGQTKEKKLEIMKDSRIGSYGAAALILVLFLKVTAIAGLVQTTGAGEAALSLAAAGALSRTAALQLAVALPPARPEGAAFAAGSPTPSAWRDARLLTLGLMALALPAGGLIGIFLCIFIALMIAVAATKLARDQVGGHTGDIAGATQQVVEVAVLLTLLIFA